MVVSNSFELKHQLFVRESYSSTSFGGTELWWEWNEISLDVSG